MDTHTHRSAKDWNGEPWRDDARATRQWEERVFAHSVEPWLTSATRALEIGCGGTRWTVLLAPRVRDLRVLDVNEPMLERTERRVLLPFATGSLDLVFSYDVFVDIAFEEAVAYISEIARLVSPGGVAILHHALGDAGPGWDEDDYYSRELLDRMYARTGLRIESTWTEDGTSVVVVARKPADSVVPRLEQALRQAAAAVDQASLDQAAAAIVEAGHDVARTVETLAASLRTAPHGPNRSGIAQQIRRFVRG